MSDTIDDTYDDELDDTGYDDEYATFPQMSERGRRAVAGGRTPNVLEVSGAALHTVCMYRSSETPSLSPASGPPARLRLGPETRAAR